MTTPIYFLDAQGNPISNDPKFDPASVLEQAGVEETPPPLDTPDEDEEDEEEEPTLEETLSAMNVNQLKTIATDAGMDISSIKKKSELVAAIIEASQLETEEEDE